MTTKTTDFANDLDFAKAMDNADPLRKFRFEFCFPQCGERKQAIYFVGNSLGLEPVNARKYINDSLDDWAFLGVEGHFEGRHPWLPYHEFVTDMTARLVGAKPIEVVAMNSLTVNLHLMLVSFYRPTKERYKILTEADCFPSDRYAVASHAEFHGYTSADAVVHLKPRDGEETLRPEDVLDFIERHGKEIALVLLGNVNYLTGQAVDLKAIAAAAHKQGCLFGTNLAHGAGNLLLNLHDDDVDFAVWCSYKYLNSGPGGIAECFVHERHSGSFDLPRLAGWWGHNKQTRFAMGPTFDPLAGAEGWQLSNPPIFQLAALRASLEYFDAAGMSELRSKSVLLTGYLEFLLKSIPNNFCTIVTPRDPNQRGAQLSVRVKGEPKTYLARLKEKGVLCDFREPDIIRAAPAPLYSSFEDVYEFANIVKSLA